MDDDYWDIGESSERVERWWAQRTGRPMLASASSSMVNEFPHKGQTLKVVVTLSGERKVGFEKTYDYEWFVLLVGSEKLSAIKGNRVEVEAVVAEDRGVFKDWSPKDKIVSGPSVSLGAGIPLWGSISIGGSKGGVSRVVAERKDLNRVFWEFRDIKLKKEAVWRAAVEGNIKVFTMPKPSAKGIGKIPEFFPIRFTVRLAFQGRRRLTRAYLSSETVVCIPSVVFLLNRDWSEKEERHGDMHGQ